VDDFDEFLDPTGEATIAQFGLATGLSTLQGARLGIIENNKTNADKFLVQCARRD
jgi:hypothetical protein